MELYRIPIKDIRPDANNPRKDFDDIDELAASFKLNPNDPGEPLQPVVTVRDGNVYRLVDGERRYRAMKQLGIIECWSNVCDSFDEATAVVQMLATDNKQSLTEHERSIGVQTMLLLGVDESTVEKAARVEGVDRIKRAMELAPRASQMTLDHLLAIAEADEAGDEEAVNALATAPEETWATKAAAFRSKRKVADDFEKAVKIAHEIGYTVLNERPEEGQLGEDDWLSSYYCTDRDELQIIFDKGFHHVFFEQNSWGVSGEVYMDAGCELDCPEEDPEEAKKRLAAEEAKQKLAVIKKDAHEWLARELIAGNVPASIASFFDEWFAETRAGSLLCDFEEMAGLEILPDDCRPIALVAYVLETRWPSDEYFVTQAIVYGEAKDYRAPHIEKWLEFYVMLQDAGWPAPEFYGAVANTLADALEANSRD